MLALKGRNAEFEGKNVGLWGWGIAIRWNAVFQGRNVVLKGGMLG